MKTIILFLRLARLPYLLGSMLLYALGAGIAHHLQASIDWGVYWTGQAWLIMLQLSFQLLDTYFAFRVEGRQADHPILYRGGDNVVEGKLPQAAAFWLAIACLTVTASLTVYLIWFTRSSQAVELFMALIGIGGLLYAVPPVRLATSGYGELTCAILLANLTPGFAFLLQHSELNRVLAMVTFPLTALGLAMFLALELPHYATDLKVLKRTLMVRLGWQNGMQLHNLLILSSYMLLALAVVLGLPMYLVWPALLTLPVGVFQIWMMNRIAAGARPNWLILSIISLVTFFLTTYMLAFSFWIH